MRLLPRDEKFFDIFTAVAQLNVEAAKLLHELFQVDALQRRPLVDQIKRLEHQADQLTHEVVDRLDRTFITPLDREDIHVLISRLDNVMDLMDGTARRVQMFQPGEAPAGAVMLAEVIHRTALALLDAVKHLESNKGGTVTKGAKQIKLLEEEGDSLYHEWVSKLFENATDPMFVMKWKEIYDTLERTLDQAEDAANVLESISIKHA
jgi:predicted phosphate transport protein (TIGR00153 family)